MDLKITANDFSIVELFSLFSDQEVEGFLESNISKNNTVDLFKFYFQEAIQFLKDVPELASI
ncbi:MAG: hypothetical protein LBF15_02085 [Candidatus Peribacteria bacterium]|jgi:hypothetical protein|nr:hypothetical protein [Candidatus Peribacteria bacterium]